MQRLLLLYRGLNIRIGGSAVVDQAVVGGTNFLMAVFVGRLCGPEELGLFALAMTIWYLLLACLESLIASPFTVFVHRLDEENRAAYAGSAMVQVLGLAIISVAALVLLAFLLHVMGYTKLAVVIAVLALTIPLRLLREFARRFHYASLNLNGALMLDISIAGLQVVACSVLYSINLLTAAGAFLAVGCAFAIVLAAWYPRQRNAFRFHRESLYPHLLKNWNLGRWLAASQITMIIASQSLPWIIAFMLNESQTGIYFGCAMLVRIGAPLLVATQNVLAPRSAAAFAEAGLVGLRNVVRKTTIGLAVGMGSFATLLAVGGGYLVQLFLGADYGGQQEVVALLAVNELAFASMLAAASGLTVLERPELLFRSQLAGILVTVTLAFSLIGQFGLPGAALAQLAGTATVSVLTICSYRYVVANWQESWPVEQPSDSSSFNSWQH